MYKATLWLGLLAAVGCGKQPVEAPEGLDEVSHYLVQNFESETDDEIIAGVVNLEAELDKIDLKSSKVDDRTFGLTTLVEADLPPSASGPLDPDAQIPVAVGAVSAHSIDDNIGVVILEPNQVCIESDTTKYAERTFVTDTACFEDGSCNLLETTNEIRKESLLAKVWYDINKTYRTVELEDGRRAVVAVSWMPSVGEADGGGTWDQNWALDVFIEDGNETKRYFAIWSSVTVGGIGDDFWATLVKNGVQQGFEFSDEFIGGGDSCKEDRNREYDRP